MPEKAIRGWVRGMVSAMTRTPQLQNANVAPAALALQQAAIDTQLGRELLSRTATGALVREADRYLAVPLQVNDDMTVLINHLEEAFLGADEAAAKRAELEKLRQKGGTKLEHAIPAYCRDFSDLADEAYAIANRNAETDLKLAELFMTSLRDDDVVKELLSFSQILSH
jgi:hypothetical protein